MDRQNVFDWLWTVSCFGCGNNRIWDVISEFQSVSEAAEMLPRSELLSERERRNAARVHPQQIDEIISYCEKHGIYILTYDDELYPERLRCIYNPPAVLFCRGDLKCLENDFSISVVGTRKPSDYSVKVTSALVKELCSFGITIVSGFAVGIDITAHLSAVSNGGKTIAVLGCGLDYDYPRENAVYRSKIEENGLFISEYFPKAAGSRISFPARNRILSGLSLGTVVAEAAEKSGALSTANLALAQGKDIFVIAPHDLFDRRYGGNVALIRDGAVCLCGIRDIVYEYYENYGHKLSNARTAMPAELPEEGSGKTYKQAMRIDPYEEPYAEAETAATEESEETESFDASLLDGEEAEVYGILKKSDRALLADEIAQMCGKDISDVLMLLTDLELDGAVQSGAGSSYTAN